MIFQKTLKQVLDGTKTVTRRATQPGHYLRELTPPKAIIGRTGRAIYEVGKTYPVQPGRGQAGIAGVRIKILDIFRDAYPMAISDAGARAEGFSSASAFKKSWRDMHGRGASSPCWAIAFELVKTSQPQTDSDELGLEDENAGGGA